MTKIRNWNWICYYKLLLGIFLTSLQNQLTSGKHIFKELPTKLTSWLPWIKPTWWPTIFAIPTWTAQLIYQSLLFVLHVVFTYRNILNGDIVRWKGQPVIPLCGHKGQDKYGQIHSKGQNGSDVVLKQIYKVTDIHMFSITSVNGRNTPIMNRQRVKKNHWTIWRMTGKQKDYQLLK